MAEPPPEAADSAAPTTGPSAGSQAQLLDYEGFLALKDLAALEAHFRASGVEGSRDAVLERAQHEWYLACLAHAKQVERTPERFEPDVGTHEGVEYRLWGLYHGMAGGSEEAYAEFVGGSLKTLGRVLFENGVGYFYKPAEKVTVPDFVVMVPFGSLRAGLYVGVHFWVLLKDLIWDVLRLGHSFDEAEPYVLSPKYHSLPVECRRGVEIHPPLSTRLMVEYELERFDAATFPGLTEPFLIVPRSMFMAGFAVGYAGAHVQPDAEGRRSVDMVVGDLHTGEILHFLEHPPSEHPVWQLGLKYGGLADGERFARIALVKTVHLTLAACVGAPLITAEIGALWWLWIKFGWLGPLGALGVVLALVLAWSLIQRARRR